MWSSSLTSTIRSGPTWPRSKDQQENEPPSPRDNLPKVSRTCICQLGEACKGLSIAFAAFKQDPRGKFVAVPQAQYETYCSIVRPKHDVDLANASHPCYVAAHHFDPKTQWRPHGQQQDLLLLPQATKMWHEEAMPNYAFETAHQDLRKAMRQHLKEVQAQSKQKRELRKTRRQEMLQIAAKRMSRSRRSSKSRVTPLIVVQDDNQKVMATKSSVSSSTTKAQQQRQQQQSSSPVTLSPASSFRIEMKPTFETAQEGEIECFLDTDEEREAELEKQKEQAQPKPKQPPKRKISCPAKEVKGAPAFTPRARTPPPPELEGGESIEVVLEEIFARNVNFFDDMSSSMLQASHQQQLNARQSQTHHETYSPERKPIPIVDPPAKAATTATDPPGSMDGSSARLNASARMDGSERHGPFQPRAMPSFRPISPVPGAGNNKPKVALKSMPPFLPVVETVDSCSDMELSSHAPLKTVPTPESQTPSEATPTTKNPFVGNFFEEGMANPFDTAQDNGNPFDQVVRDTVNPFAAAAAQPNPFDTAPNPFDTTERVIRSAPSTGGDTFATAGGETFATATDPFNDTPLSPTKSVQSNPFARAKDPFDNTPLSPTKSVQSNPFAAPSASSPPNPFDTAVTNETAADAAAAAAALGVFEDFPTTVRSTASFAEKVFEESVQEQQKAKKQEEEYLVKPRSSQKSAELPLTPTMSAIEDEEEDNPSVSELQGEFVMPDPPAAEPSEREEEKEEIEAFKSADQEEMEEQALMGETIPEPIVASKSYDTCEEEEEKEEEEIVVQPMGGGPTTGEMARSIATTESSGIVSIPLTPTRGSEQGAPRSAAAQTASPFGTPLHETPARASAFGTPMQTAEKAPKSAPRALFGPDDTKGLFSEEENRKAQPAGLGGFQEGEEPVEDDFRNLLRASHVVVQSSDQSSNLDSSGHQDDIDLGDVSSTAGDEHSMDSKPKMIFVSQAESEKAARGELEVEPSICYHNNPRNIVIFYGCMVLLSAGNIHYKHVLEERKVLELEMAALETPPDSVLVEGPTAAPWALSDGGEGEEVNPLADIDMEPESEVLAPETLDDTAAIEGDSETKPAKSSWFWRSSPDPVDDASQEAAKDTAADSDNAMDAVDSHSETEIQPEEKSEAGSLTETVEGPTPKSSWFWRSSPTSSPGDANLVNDEALPEVATDSTTDVEKTSSSDTSAENLETGVSETVEEASLEVPTQAPKKKSSSWFWKGSPEPSNVGDSDTGAEMIGTTAEDSESSAEADSAQTGPSEKQEVLQESMESTPGSDTSETNNAEDKTLDKTLPADVLQAEAQARKKSSWVSWRSTDDSLADKPSVAEEQTVALGAAEDVEARAETRTEVDTADGEVPLSKDEVGGSQVADLRAAETLGSDVLEQASTVPPIEGTRKSSWFWSKSPSSSPTSDTQAPTNSKEEDNSVQEAAITPEEDSVASTSAIGDAGAEQDNLVLGEFQVKDTVGADGTTNPQAEGGSTNTEDDNHATEESTTAEKGGKSSWFWGKSAPSPPADGAGTVSEGPETDELGGKQDVATQNGEPVEADELARSDEFEGTGAAVSEPADQAEINSSDEMHTYQTDAGMAEDTEGTQEQGVEDEERKEESASEQSKESSSSWFWSRSSAKRTKSNPDEILGSSSTSDRKDYKEDESGSLEDIVKGQDTELQHTDPGDDDASLEESKGGADPMVEDIVSTDEGESKSSSSAASSDSMGGAEVTVGDEVDQAEATNDDTAKPKKPWSIWACRDSSDEPTHEVIDLDSSSDETEDGKSSGQDKTSEASDEVNVAAKDDEPDGGAAEAMQFDEASSSGKSGFEEAALDDKTATIDGQEAQEDDISDAQSSQKSARTEEQSSWIWQKLGMTSSDDGAASPKTDAVSSMGTAEHSIEDPLISKDDATASAPGSMDMEASGAAEKPAEEKVVIQEPAPDSQSFEETGTHTGSTSADSIDEKGDSNADVPSSKSAATMAEEEGPEIGEGAQQETVDLVDSKGGASLAAEKEDHLDVKQQEEKAASWWQYFVSSEKKEKEHLTVDSAAPDVSVEQATGGDVHGVPVDELPDYSGGTFESSDEELSTGEGSHDSTKEQVEDPEGQTHALPVQKDAESQYAFETIHSGDQSLRGDKKDSVLVPDELDDAPSVESTTQPTWMRVFKPTSAEKGHESTLADETVEELGGDGPNNEDAVDSEQLDSVDDQQNLSGDNTEDNAKESGAEELDDMEEASHSAQTKENTIEEEAMPEMAAAAAADTDQFSDVDQSVALEPGKVETGESMGTWSLGGSLGSFASSAKSYIFSESKNEQHLVPDESKQDQSLDESTDTKSDDIAAAVDEKASLGGEEATSLDSEATPLGGEGGKDDATAADSIATSEDMDLTKTEEAETTKTTGSPEENGQKEESGWQWTNKLRKAVGLESESPSEDVTKSKASGEDLSEDMAPQQREESMDEELEAEVAGREVNEDTEDPGSQSAASDVAGPTGESMVESVEPDTSGEEEETEEDSIEQDKSSGVEESIEDKAEGGDNPAVNAGLLDKWKGMANSFADYAKYTKSTPPPDDKAVETPEVASETESSDALLEQEAMVQEDGAPTVETEDTPDSVVVDKSSSVSDTKLVDEPNVESLTNEPVADVGEGEGKIDAGLNGIEGTMKSGMEGEPNDLPTEDSNDVGSEPKEAMPSDKTLPAGQSVEDSSSEQLVGASDDVASTKLKELLTYWIVRWYNSGFALESVLLVLGAYFYWGRG